VRSSAVLPIALAEGIDHLRALAAAQREVAERLVLLEEFSLPGLAASVAAMRVELLERHVPNWEPRLRAGALRNDARAGVLRREHGIFAGSLGQLDWLLGIVAGEPHGGHRQALGQYWRIFLEALDRHLVDELRTIGPEAPRSEP
jgi:hypothetical protein